MGPAKVVLCLFVLSLSIISWGCSGGGPSSVVGQIEEMQVRDDRLISISIRDDASKLRTFTVKDPGALNEYVSVQHLREEHQEIDVPVTLFLEDSKVVRIDD